MTLPVIHEVAEDLRAKIGGLQDEEILELVFSAAKGRGTPIDLNYLLRKDQPPQLAASTNAVVVETTPVPPAGAQANTGGSFDQDKEVAKSSPRPTRRRAFQALRAEPRVAPKAVATPKPLPPSKRGKTTQEGRQAAILSALEKGPMSWTALIAKANLFPGRHVSETLRRLVEAKTILKSGSDYSLASKL